MSGRIRSPSPRKMSIAWRMTRGRTITILAQTSAQPQYWAKNNDPLRIHGLGHGSSTIENVFFKNFWGSKIGEQPGWPPFSLRTSIICWDWEQQNPSWPPPVFYHIDFKWRRGWDRITAIAKTWFLDMESVMTAYMANPMAAWPAVVDQDREKTLVAHAD